MGFIIGSVEGGTTKVVSVERTVLSTVSEGSEVVVITAVVWVLSETSVILGESESPVAFLPKGAKAIATIAITTARTQRTIIRFRFFLSLIIKLYPLNRRVRFFHEQFL
ncbi:MAG: hypothetical protein E7529_04880 [Ruminococcaceae bacterium]|nr:hypothetical protein [Oscillospiraceae bacterium]